MEGLKSDTSRLLVSKAGLDPISESQLDAVHCSGSMQAIATCAKPIMTVPAASCPFVNQCSDESTSNNLDAVLQSKNKLGNGNAPRRTKLLSIWQFLTLRGLFQILGQSIGAYPLFYIGLSLLISCTSFGMFKMVLKDRIREGYTPINAPSRYEMDVMREFWNSTGDPMTMIVLLRAKDDGSMLRDEYLDEVMRVHNFFVKNHTVIYNNESVKFRDFCSPYCAINYNLMMFIECLKDESSLIQNGGSVSSGISLTYPVANLDGIDLHIERHLFGVQLKSTNDSLIPENTNNSTTSATSGGGNYARIITNMEYVKVIMMVFRGDKPNVTFDKALTLWELEAFKYSREVYSNKLVDLQIIGSEILEMAMTKDGQRLTPYFAAGFLTMMAFVTITVMASAIFYDAMDWGKALVACGAIMCPILSILTTYGLISLLGIRTNSFMLVMPFLIMGIGVDDGFLMIHSWQRLALCSSTTSIRLGLVFEEVGPSITVTSLTNFISFGIGALTPTPEIRLFCIATATAMGLDYLYELILFGPVLALATRCEKANIKNYPFTPSQPKSLHGWRFKIDCLMRWLLKKYCNLIGHWVFTVIISVLAVVYWYFAIVGALQIKTRLDTVKILPKDSPMQAPNQILNDIVWADYHAVTILVNNAFDIRRGDQVNRFYQLVDDFEQLPHCRVQSTLLWLRDYQRFYKSPPFNFLDLLFGKTEIQTTTIATTTSADFSGFDYNRLDEFLDSFFYSHWKTFLNIERSREGPVVRKFWFSVAYKNMSSWEDRIEIMQTWRNIASKYQDLNVTVFEPNGMFVDQMLSLKTVAVQTGVLTLMCMAMVCIVFIPNPCSVITASIAIASISLGVFGFLSWWGFDLDPVTMAAVLMSIGLSVDFTAHVSYHYQLTSHKEIRNGQVVKIPVSGPQEKLEHTLQTVGWPMIQAGASTVMCIMPLLFLRSYSPLVFLKTIFLVVAWGLLHGLVALPALLAALPDCLTDANCYRTFLSSSSQRSCRYAGPAELEPQDLEVNEIDVV